MMEFVQIVVRAFLLKMGWCLVEEQGGEKRVFFVHATMVKYPRIGTGSRVIFTDYPQTGQLVAPSRTDELLVLKYEAAQPGGKYPQATLVVFKSDYEKVLVSQRKSNETLAKKAEEAAEAERKRQETIIRSREMKGQSGKSKKKQMAGSR